jgi:hypothetical protein
MFQTYCSSRCGCPSTLATCLLLLLRASLFCFAAAAAAAAVNLCAILTQLFTRERSSKGLLFTFYFLLLLLETLSAKTEKFSAKTEIFL